MSACYWLIAGATMERTRAWLHDSAWVAPAAVVYVLAALAGVLWPVAVPALLIWGRTRL